MYKIFVVEDDMAIAEALTKHLINWGWDVKYAIRFDNITDQFLEYVPELVLLDVTLPKFNGYYWCKEIRKISKVPIVFLSGAGDNMNIVMAMDMGGDDFIVKPFDVNVLTAKISAVLRRTYSFRDSMNVIEHKGVILNVNGTYFVYNGNRSELTKNEFKILHVLMENVGKVVTRDSLMAQLWENGNFIDDNTLTVNVNRLRKKLEDAGIHDFVQTKKGTGYIIKE